MATTKNGAADRDWGYEFGIDGLMSPAEAQDYLSLSDLQLNGLASKQFIRLGKLPTGLRRFCRRSIVEFAGGLEV